MACWYIESDDRLNVSVGTLLLKEFQGSNYSLKSSYSERSEPAKRSEAVININRKEGYW